MSESEHSIRIRAVHVYECGFDSSFIDENGELGPKAMDLGFQHEQSLVFKCECGRNFYKKNGSIAPH